MLLFNQKRWEFYGMSLADSLSGSRRIVKSSLAVTKRRRWAKFGGQDPGKGKIMSVTQTREGSLPKEEKEKILVKYQAAALASRLYFVRRQRKAVLENCRRIAVVGANRDPDSKSFVSLEKLLGLGLEVIPVMRGCESCLGIRCFSRLLDVPGKIDIVQVYPGDGIDLMEIATQAVEKGVTALWVEQGMAGSEVEEILGNGKVQLIEHESLETEYLKHFPSAGTRTQPPAEIKRAVRVAERMTRNPITVKPNDSIKDAVRMMENGHFRHLPVVDEKGKLLGILSDRDIRLIRPSLAFVPAEDAMVQLWSIAVQQAAVFDPVTVRPDSSLGEAAQLMLRWQVGGLPVVDGRETLVGVITYTDLLREFVAREESK
jgi:CBS domain-containing protein/predicted CoA-binding protein